ncbi:MAG: dephospho-CoA kinase [Syntrophotalea sp.]|uniref:dephospho-CoA kinase n=1 Tax=Syntrophotalea sp. TaxID=2812029 RepID=UPI003D0CE327
MMILGLTGGIGSGKSVVAKMFRELGADVVGADGLAREIVTPGAPVLVCLVERFGDAVLCADGSLNRSWLAQTIFSDSRARRDLDRITHPAIAELARQRFAELAEHGARIVIYDAPLLFEAGADKQVDAVAVVAVREDIQLRRLMARDHLDEAAARARIASQMPLPEKIRRADYVIDNNGTLAQTRRQVVLLMARLVSMAGEGPVRPENAE